MKKFAALQRYSSLYSTLKYHHMYSSQKFLMPLLCSFIGYFFGMMVMALSPCSLSNLGNISIFLWISFILLRLYEGLVKLFLHSIGSLTEILSFDYWKISLGSKTLFLRNSKTIFMCGIFNLLFKYIAWRALNFFTWRMSLLRLVISCL